MYKFQGTIQQYVLRATRHPGTGGLETQHATRYEGIVTGPAQVAETGEAMDGWWNVRGAGGEVTAQPGILAADGKAVPAWDEVDFSGAIRLAPDEAA